MSDIQNPFVLLERITVRPGTIKRYPRVTTEADKLVEKTKYRMLVHNFDVDPVNLTSFK